MLKLHLGCGKVHINGYVNVDHRYQPGTDLVEDIGHLRSFKDNTLDVIYSPIL